MEGRCVGVQEGRVEEDINKSYGDCMGFFECLSFKIILLIMKRSHILTKVIGYPFIGFKTIY